ncbi:MAG TPA: hypothetical protein ENH12_00030 [Proteobacteria bacterium]|nr:hypothetical protein [Pseudomonadota bacterium]
MESIINKTLGSLELGKLQVFENMAVIPLFTDIGEGPEYITMKEALQQDLVTVTEASAGGSVPELRVINEGDIPILLLDGEELSGAKQNRILNTTILIKEKSETIIPVSCTEQGRWSYASRDFKDSGNIVYASARVDKLKSVSYSLRQGFDFRSDQGEVWENVAEAASCLGSSSPTEAMKDIYEDRQRDLNDYLDSFSLQPGQHGLIAVVRGKIGGFDLLSRESAYRDLHDKLVKSYALDALISSRGNRDRDRDSGETTEDKRRILEKAKTFLQAVGSCREKRYSSVGYGWDYRFSGGGMVGSALVYKETLIHSAFFRSSGNASERNSDPISSFHRRRSYRER